MVEGKTAYPLCWPAGYKRTSSISTVDGGSVFGRRWSPDRVRRLLEDEVCRLNGRGLILSTNAKLRKDGAPYSNPPRFIDYGVAIYFTFGKRDVAMACDLYDSIWANMRALTLCIESLRRLRRHGGGEILDRAFTGFAALPSSIIPAIPWWVLLGWDDDQGLKYDADDVEAAFRDRARLFHPDKPGGSEEAFRDLQTARTQALEAIQ